MEKQSNSIKFFFLLYKKRLRNHYDEKEIVQFLYILFEKYLGWGKAEVHLRSDERLSDKDSRLLNNALSELSKHKPIQYITGVAFFSGLELAVNSSVLIPRPETEELVDIVMKDTGKRKKNEVTILDIGTGSGCIAISLKHKLPKARVTAMDISAEALTLAAANAKRYRCAIRFHQGDILDPEEMKDFPSYDIIVSNPPYVLKSERTTMRPNVLDYEPSGALFVPGKDPMRFYIAIAAFALHHLVRRGILYLEINERFGNEVRELLLSQGFQKIEIIRDIHQKDRFIKAFLTNESLNDIP